MLVNVPHSAVQQASSRPFVLHTLFRELTRRASNRYRLDPLNKSERRVARRRVAGCAVDLDASDADLRNRNGLRRRSSAGADNLARDVGCLDWR